jgi:nicotinamidase-related amidase
VRPRSHALFSRDNTVLVAVDLQEPFLRHIHQREALLGQCSLLIQAAMLMNVPIITTTQYAQRMGPLLPEITDLLGPGALPAIDKLTFSSAASQTFLDTLMALGREQVLICGVETHICVQQTALDLVHLDFQVQVAADGVSSRRFDQHKLGMEKMRDCGVLPVASEGAVMELLYEAGTPEFKSILVLIK